MKNLRLLVLFLMLCCILIIHGCSIMEKGKRLVDKHGVGAKWSGDGQTLIYLKGEDSNLYLYNTNTRKRSVLQLSAPTFVSFDSSPDGKSIVIQDYYKQIKIINIFKAKATRISILKNYVHKIFWLTPDQLIYTIESPDATSYDLYSLNLNTKKSTKILGHASQVIRSYDSPTFIYTQEFQYYLYDVANRTTKALKSDTLTGPNSSAELIFLSKRQAIYYVEYAGAENKTRFYTLDIASMKTKEFNLPDTTNHMGISPDLTKYWYVYEYGHGDWYSPSGSELYLVDIPVETIKQIKGNPSTP